MGFKAHNVSRRRLLLERISDLESYSDQISQHAPIKKQLYDDLKNDPGYNPAHPSILLPGEVDVLAYKRVLLSATLVSTGVHVYMRLRAEGPGNDYFIPVWRDGWKILEHNTPIYITSETYAENLKKIRALTENGRDIIRHHTVR